MHGAVDWEALRRAADGAAGRAYAPYSRLRVGAAGLCEDGARLGWPREALPGVVEVTAEVLAARGPLVLERVG